VWQPFSTSPLRPILGIGGISSQFLFAFLDKYAVNAKEVEFKNTGHWIIEERPHETAEELIKFFS
jgi:hypothetical protein